MPVEQPTERAIVFYETEKKIILRSAKPSILTIIDQFDTPPSDKTPLYSRTFSCRDERGVDVAVTFLKSKKDAKEIDAVLVMYPTLTAYYR